MFFSSVIEIYKRINDAKKDMEYCYYYETDQDDVHEIIKKLHYELDSALVQLGRLRIDSITDRPTETWEKAPDHYKVPLCK